MTRALVTVLVLALALSQIVPAFVYAQVIVVGNDEKVIFDDYLDKDLSVLKVDGTTVTNTGKRLTLPGHPASMRGRSR